MKKKASPKTARHALHVRIRESDDADFKLAAESEGFNSVSAWVLYHLRKKAKETLADQ